MRSTSSRSARRAPWLALIALLLACIPAAHTTLAQSTLAQSGGSRQLPESATHKFAKVLAFEPNRGQTDPQVKFLTRGPGYTAFLTLDGAVLRLKSRGASAVVRMEVLGASPSARITGAEQLRGEVNYIGISGRQSLAGIPTFARLEHEGVYPGIDLVYYAREGELEYDFVIAPGADPNTIALLFHGADKLEVNDSGELLLQTPAGTLRQRTPFIYQDVDGVRKPVSGGYVMTGERQVAFRVGAYDDKLPLVIDPVLLYSSYLGGSGDDVATDIALDSAGNIYLTGVTTSPDFPTTAGVANPGPLGRVDAFVTKLDPNGNIVYSTYFGANCDDSSNAIAVDTAGNAYVTGRINDGVCFPIGPAGAYVAKFNALGQLAYFFQFGGSLADISTGQAIAVDSSGHAYVTGLAHSNSNDFPTTPGAFQRTPGAFLADGFVAKINPAGTGFVYSTLLGGNDHESANAIAIDAAGNAYITGSTVSQDFPVTTGALQPTHPGCPTPGFCLTSSAFIAKLNPSGSALVYSSYLGGDLDTGAQGIAVDGSGNAYVTGWTQAENFPTTPGVLQPTQGDGLCFPALCTDAFVTKFSPTGAVVYSTYLSGDANDQGTDIKVDAAGNAYVVGETTSLYFPHLNAFQPNIGGLFDVFVSKLNATGSALIYSSYLGGGVVHDQGLEGWDTGLGIALDAAGNAYVTGRTISYNFPVTSDARQPAYRAGFCGFFTLCSDAFVTKIAASGPGVLPTIRLSASPTSVQVGGTVTATWSGLPAPNAFSDTIALYGLGKGGIGGSSLQSWSTGGTASGTLALALPATATPGWYELRIVSPRTPGGLGEVVARTEPIRVFASGGPQAPDAPSGLGQFRSDGTTALAVGASTTESSVVLKFSMSDANNPDTLTAEVEVKPVASAFNETAVIAGAAMSYSGSPVQGTVSVTGLATGTQYHWRARVRDASGAVSAWVSFGGNAESAADFAITAVSPGTPVNVAAQANGGVATASSAHSAGYAPTGANNGDRKGLNWGSGGGWNDATPDAFPDWLQVSFSGAQTISEISVFSVQDNFQAPVEPTPSMTFSQYGLTHFQVQYWNGSAWLDVPGGNITNNNLVWRRISFTPITTDRIRVLVNSALASWSRVAEIEAWTAASAGASP